MDKRELALLEAAFSSEIGAALEGTPRPIQPRGKLVQKLVADGLLAECTEVWRGITIKGYELTHAGRFVYCSTCEDAPEPTP